MALPRGTLLVQQHWGLENYAVTELLRDSCIVRPFWHRAPSYKERLEQGAWLDVYEYIDSGSRPAYHQKMDS